MFDSQEDVVRWARFNAYENKFVCEWDVIRVVSIGGCPFKFCFKFCSKPMVGEQDSTVELICEIHNHKLTNSLVEHPCPK